MGEKYSQDSEWSPSNADGTFVDLQEKQIRTLTPDFYQSVILYCRWGVHDQTTITLKKQLLTKDDS